MANLLYLVTEKFANIDLHPEAVSNSEMGLVFEELIRRFAELSNETAGEHFTPREVIRLMVNLLFIEDDDAIRAALGDETISFLGISYGTYLGAVYATMFPNRVRAMVLDSAHRCDGIVQ